MTLNDEVRPWTEPLARNAHDNGVKQRRADRWRWGPRRDDTTKEHPCLVPDEQLPPSDNEYDRNAATQTLKGILARGYRIEKR